ncbi:MAG: L,D-transpeptidase family protein [Pseudomonadota bacterium]|nr:L,D-transpeptidase family protein [Pseudomonadota bacterium]
MNETDLIASASGKLRANGAVFDCTLGRNGTVNADEKREGDGASPLGRWRLKRVFYRSDRLPRPKTELPTVPLRPQDGWCDAEAHPLYNRPVTLPFAASHEALWRDDHAYDLIVELAHNDAPVVPGMGSAIFMHVTHDDGRPTAGCVALAASDLLAILEHASTDTCLVITH